MIVLYAPKLWCYIFLVGVKSDESDGGGGGGGGGGGAKGGGGREGWNYRAEEDNILFTCTMKTVVSEHLQSTLAS